MMLLQLKFRALTFAFAVLCASSSVMAQRVGMVNGAGLVGCGEFLEDRKSDRFKQYYTQWVQGYLSAYNLFSSHPQIARIPDEATIDAYLQKHCRDNPLASVINATAFLIGDLGGFKPIK